MTQWCHLVTLTTKCISPEKLLMTKLNEKESTRLLDWNSKNWKRSCELGRLSKIGRRNSERKRLKSQKGKKQRNELQTSKKLIILAQIICKKHSKNTRLLIISLIRPVKNTIQKLKLTLKLKDSKLSQMLRLSTTEQWEMKTNG